jgi:hypothetical protein
MNTIESHLNPFHIILWSRSRPTQWCIPLGFSYAVLVSTLLHAHFNLTYLITRHFWYRVHITKSFIICNLLNHAVTSSPQIQIFCSASCPQSEGHNFRPLQSKITVLYIFACTTPSTRQQQNTILNPMEANIPWIWGAARRSLCSSNLEPAKTDEAKVSRFL